MFRRAPHSVAYHFAVEIYLACAGDKDIGRHVMWSCDISCQTKLCVLIHAGNLRYLNHDRRLRH